jgi:predicted HTH domain antitoxin
MAMVQVELEDELASLLSQLKQPVPQAARECIVFELYRRSLISSGKAAQLLKVSRADFLKHASQLGIPYFNMTAEALEAEIAVARSL